MTTEDYKAIEPMLGVLHDAVRLKTIVGLSLTKRQTLVQVYNRNVPERDKVNGTACGSCILRVCAFLHAKVQEYQQAQKKPAKRKK